MVGLPPKVSYRVRTAEGKRNQVIHLVIPFIGGRYPVFRIRLFSKGPRNGPHLLRVPRRTNILEGYLKHVARGQLRIGQDRLGLLTENGKVPYKAYGQEDSANAAHMLTALFSHFGAKRNFVRPGSVTYTARSK